VISSKAGASLLLTPLLAWLSFAIFGSSAANAKEQIPSAAQLTKAQNLSFISYLIPFSKLNNVGLHPTTRANFNSLFDLLLYFELELANIFKSCVGVK